MTELYIENYHVSIRPYGEKVQVVIGGGTDYVFSKENWAEINSEIQKIKNISEEPLPPNFKVQ